MQPDTDELMNLMMIFPRKMTAVSKGLTSKYLKDTRVKAHHIMIIHGISLKDGPSQKDLVELLPFDKSYISMGVRELIDMGFVRNDAEGKVQKLYLTDTGSDILAMCKMMVDIIQPSILSAISAEEKQSLTTILKKIDVHVDELIDQLSHDDS